MGLKNKLRATVSGLTSTQQVVLTFIASALPPVIVLLQQQSSNPYLYGASLFGALLAVAVKMLAEPVIVVEPTPVV